MEVRGSSHDRGHESDDVMDVGGCHLGAPSEAAWPFARCSRSVSADMSWSVNSRPRETPSSSPKALRRDRGLDTPSWSRSADADTPAAASPVDPAPRCRAETVMCLLLMGGDSLALLVFTDVSLVFGLVFVFSGLSACPGLKTPDRTLRRTQ